MPQVVEAHRQVGQEGLGIGLRQLAVDVHGLLRRRSASSRRPRSESMMPRLLRLIARSGRKAWGLASASLR